MKSRRKLDRRTVKEIERFLEDKHAELTGAVRSVIAQRRTQGGGRSAEPASWAFETLHDEIEVALVDQRSRQVEQIRAALERLGRGEYGICRDCGEFIGLARLRALPFTQRCSRCQSRAEQPVGVASRRVPAGMAAAEEDE